jgi:glycerol-3-phosphate acyltransferase PlsY
MKLGEQALARILGFLACVGLMWAGIGFAGFALTAALTPSLSLAGAAGVTAVVLLIVPLFVFVAYGGRTAGSPEAKGPENILGAIAQIAKERPLLAMVGAALFGAAEVILNSRRKKK